MQKIKKILFKQPLLSLAGLCFVIALASPFIFVESKSQAKQEAQKSITSTVTVTATPSEEDEQSVQGQTSYNYAVTPTHSASSGQAPTTTSNITAATATSAPQPTHSASSGQATPAAKTFQVSLKINGSSVGNVELPEGANQCDVLAKAKDQGKISSLLMKYDNSLGTNGVYQINGIGKENTVWWVYKVNGASPSQGCSYVKANSGDSVEWEYKG